TPSTSTVSGSTGTISGSRRFATATTGSRRCYRNDDSPPCLPWRGPRRHGGNAWTRSSSAAVRHVRIVRRARIALKLHVHIGCRGELVLVDDRDRHAARPGLRGIERDKRRVAGSRRAAGDVPRILDRPAHVCRASGVPSRRRLFALVEHDDGLAGHSYRGLAIDGVAELSAHRDTGRTDASPIVLYWVLLPVC